MSPQERASQALESLKQAVLDFLADHPEGVTTADARTALGLESPDLNGERKDHLFWGLHNLLETEGRVELRPVGKRKRLFLAPQTSGTNG